MNETFTTKSADPKNPGLVIITVRGKDYSVPAGSEQSVANEIAANLGG